MFNFAVVVVVQMKFMSSDIDGMDATTLTMSLRPIFTVTSV